LFIDESDARINKIDGYSLHLLKKRTITSSKFREIYLITKNGVNIRNYTTMKNELPSGKKTAEIEADVNGSDQEIAGEILQNMDKYRCCLYLFEEVNKA
jgi:hypothetical protein